MLRSGECQYERWDTPCGRLKVSLNRGGCRLFFVEGAPIIAGDANLKYILIFGRILWNSGKFCRGGGTSHRPTVPRHLTCPLQQTWTWILPGFLACRSLLRPAGRALTSDWFIHPAGRALTSDWCANSFIMASMRTFFSHALDRKFWLNLKSNSLESNNVN